ncbi:MAG TPA: metal-dependent hydrolase [Hymenobacter sp.]
MPGYKGHIIGATACTSAYAGALSLAPNSVLGTNHYLVSDFQLVIGLFVLGNLFGLFPDIDTNSKGQDIFYAIAFVADIILLYNGRVAAAAFLGLLAMLPILSHHRGWTHSKPAMLLVPLPILLVPYLYNEAYLGTALVAYGAAVVGYFSHLLFDGKITKLVHIKGRSRAYE